MKKALIFFTIIVFFLSANICTFCGIDYNFVLSAEILLGVILSFCNPHKLKFKSLSWLIFLVVIFGLFKLITDKGGGTRISVLQIIGAPLLLAAYYKNTNSGLLSNKNIKSWSSIFRLFIMLFLAIAGFAILERIIGHSIFGWAADSTYDIKDSITDYRSSSIMGHPLYNALCISTMMSFLLISPIKGILKFSLWIVGYVSILCFNTRGSIVGNAALFFIYILHLIFADKKMSIKSKIKILFCTFVISLLGLYLFFNLELGGRLLELGLFDEGSAQVRIDSWNLFDYIDINNLLWGYNSADIELMMFKADLSATENFWIDIIMKFGLVFFITYIIIYFKVIKHLYKGYSLFNVLFTAGTFLFIASTNNSLSANFIALFLFLIAIILFNPNNIRKIISSKFIE